MNKIDITNDIKELLEEQRISAALDFLDNTVMSEISLRKLKVDIDKIRESYLLMSRYALDGMADPSRPQLFSSLVDSILSLAEYIDRQSRINEAPTLYFNTLRFINLQRTDTLSSLVAEYRHINDKLSLSVLAENVDKAQRELTLKAENLEKRIFNFVWTSHPLTVDDQTLIQSVIMDPALPSHFKSLVISAVMMGLMEYYDERRMRILMDSYESEDSGVSIRALCGILLGFWRHSSRNLSQKLQNRFDALTELPIWKSDVSMMQLQFIRARSTERIIKKMDEEVIPEMMKLRPELEKLKNNVSDIESLEANPEWEEIIEKSGVADKLRELQEIQEDGGDVLMGTFSKLKTFPFFNEMPNWFLPFHTNHSMITTSANPNIGIFFDMMAASPFFCDSDKYSMFLSLSQIPEQQLKIMSEQIKAHSDQMMEANLNSINAGNKNRKDLANKYIQNIYRFFKLFRRKGEFIDPFESSLNLIDHPLLWKSFDDVETLELLGEFYFKHKYFNDAYEIFKKLSDMMPPSAELFQKLGYCKQTQGDDEEALEWYEKSELLDSKSRWTIQSMATCHRHLRNWDKALKYYRQLEGNEPDNLKIANNIALCLLSMRKHEEALNYLFKVEFLSGINQKLARRIVRSSIMVGDYERARKYSGIVLTDKPNPNDYLNAGHIELLTGNYNQAVEMYAHSIVEDDFDTSEFLYKIADDEFLFYRVEGMDELLKGIITDRAEVRAHELGAPI